VGGPGEGGGTTSPSRGGGSDTVALPPRCSLGDGDPPFLVPGPRGLCAPRGTLRIGNPAGLERLPTDPPAGPANVLGPAAAAALTALLHQCPTLAHLARGPWGEGPPAGGQGGGEKDRDGLRNRVITGWGGGEVHCRLFRWSVVRTRTLIPSEVPLRWGDHTGGVTTQWSPAPTSRRCHCPEIRRPPPTARHPSGDPTCPPACQAFLTLARSS